MIKGGEFDTMSDWNSEKYLLFKKQRTQPAADLANRVRDCHAETIVDIGCCSVSSGR